LQIGWASVMRMSVDLRDLFLYEAFLYYNPLLLVVSYDFLIVNILSFPYSFIFFILEVTYFILIWYCRL
jgi:hypothetical protein